jgi:hypothetical protein
VQLFNTNHDIFALTSLKWINGIIVKSSQYVLLILILFSSGCTYNLIKSDFENDEQYYNEINKIAKGRTIVLETKDSTFDSEEIIINEDSLIGKYKSKKYPSFSYERIEKQYTIPIENIKSIAVTTRTSSIARGLGIGLLTDAVFGGTFFDFGGDSNSGIIRTIMWEVYFLQVLG